MTVKFCLGVQNEAGQSLIELCKENTLVIANTLSQQHKRQTYTWIPPNGEDQNEMNYVIFLKMKIEKLCIVSKNKMWHSLWLIMSSFLKNSDLN